MSSRNRAGNKRSKIKCSRNAKSTKAGFRSTVNIMSHSSQESRELPPAEIERIARRAADERCSQILQDLQRPAASGIAPDSLRRIRIRTMELISARFASAAAAARKENG